MAKIVIDVRDRRSETPAEFARGILKGVLAELWSILLPPPQPRPKHRKTWARRVDNGKWVQVWFYQY